MPITTLNALAQSSAERLLNSTIEGLALALLAWLALRLLPRQNAGTRFSVWMAALLSIATLPVAEALARVDRSGTPLAAVSHAPLAVPAAWGTALFVAWAVIAMLLLARVAVGVLQLRRLRNSAEEVDLASVDPLPRQTLADFHQHRRVSLCVSESVSVPTAVGLFRPAVVLPIWALKEFSAEDLNSVLIHELAHLRRRDDWTNLLQKLVRAVFFFHPAVWWIENRLSLEREMACDEHVLATAANPHAYAECLVSLAEKGFLHRAVLLAQGAVYRVRECSARVTQILSNGRPRTAAASRLALVGAASGSVLLLTAFAQAPSLVRFSSPAAADYANAAHETPTASLQLAGSVTPAAWRLQSQSPLRAMPAIYVPQQPAAQQQVSKPERLKDKPSSVRKNPTVQPGLSMQPSAPGLYRAGFAAPSQVNPGTLVIVRETAFYTNGSQVFTVSIYRMTVLKPHPAAKNDNPRKAI